MLNCLLNKIELTLRANGPAQWARSGGTTLCAAVLLAAVAGCQSASPEPGSPPVWPSTSALYSATNNQPAELTKSLILQEGDTIKVDFPGAANLNTIQSIRRDGKITLQSVGEFVAAGKTPAELETELKKLYEKELVNSEVSVTVQQSAFAIYVMGSVGRPGRIISDRPLSPMEALIEAGIDPSKSNLRAVTVIRTDKSGHTEKFKLNLYKVLHKRGGEMPSFTLKPLDIIYVPERFSFY